MSRILEWVTCSRSSKGPVDHRYKEAQKLQHKLKKNQYDLEDFRNQLQQMKKMVPWSRSWGLFRHGKDDEADGRRATQREGIEAYRGIIDSMTREERANPGIINGSRRLRISKGAHSVQEVNQLLKRFTEALKLSAPSENRSERADERDGGVTKRDASLLIFFKELSISEQYIEKQNRRISMAVKIRLCTAPEKETVLPDCRGG